MGQINKEVDIMPKRMSRNVKCPFYHGHDGAKIKCEGVSDDTAIHLVFGDSIARAIYMRDCCNKIQACQTCWIHKMLYTKWEQNDE